MNETELKKLLPINDKNWRMLYGRESLSAEDVLKKFDSDKKFKKYILNGYRGVKR